MRSMKDILGPMRSMKDILGHETYEGHTRSWDLLLFKAPNDCFSLGIYSSSQCRLSLPIKCHFIIAPYRSGVAWRHSWHSTFVSFPGSWARSRLAQFLMHIEKEFCYPFNSRAPLFLNKVLHFQKHTDMNLSSELCSTKLLVPGKGSFQLAVQSWHCCKLRKGSGAFFWELGSELGLRSPFLGVCALFLFQSIQLT